MDTLSMLLPLLLAVIGFSSALDDLCTDKCQFDKSCTETDYVQHTPCSYSCVCDGEYTYHVEDTFTECGRGKRCYQGDCLTEVPNRCQALYGSDCMGLLNPSNPCVYYCLNVYSPCILYEENVVDGGRCYTYSNFAGNCFAGRCAAATGGLPFVREVYYDEDRTAAEGGDGSADGSDEEDTTGYDRGDRMGRVRGSTDGSGDPSPTYDGGASSDGDGTASATGDRKTTTTGNSMAYGGGSGSTYPENIAPTTEGTRSGSETTTEGSGTGSTTEDRTTILSNDQGASFIGNRGRVGSATSSGYGVAYASGAGDRRASARSGALTVSSRDGSLAAAGGTASAEGRRATAASGSLAASGTGGSLAAAGGTASAEGRRANAAAGALAASNRGGSLAAAGGTAYAEGRRANAAAGALAASNRGGSLAAAGGTASAEGRRASNAQSSSYSYGDPRNFAFSGNYANNGGNYFYRERDYYGDAGANYYPYNEYEFVNDPIYSSDGNFDYEMFWRPTGSAVNARRNSVAASGAVARSNYGGIDGDE